MTKYKLQTIRISHNKDTGALTGIIIELSNGTGWLSDEMFRTGDCEKEIKSHSIDIKDEIRSISMLVADKIMYGLRLKNDKGELIYNQTWCST